MPRKPLLAAIVLLILTSLACSASNAIQRVFGSGGGLEKSVEIVEDELDTEGCYTTYADFEKAWNEQIFEELALQGKTCDSGVLNAYRDCLQTKILQEGMCLDEAAQACQPEYAVLSPAFPSGSANLPLDVSHSEAQDVYAYINITGGEVEGFVGYILKDRHLCTINVAVEFRGEYDSMECNMYGAADMTLFYDGTACASVWGSSPNSTTSCPVSKSGESTWEATVKDGILHGAAGGEDCDPSCVGFWATY